ncbi:MAG: hypothetical protein MK078_00640 [Crocinitomicaceae bacterium]|nr:hypothetical protein [Crocinitomicaceae bacterium]
MRKFLFFPVVILLMSLAQDNICEVYIPIDEGTKLTYEDYNEKDKLQGSQSIEILSVRKSDARIDIGSKIESFDKKGETLGENEFNYSCENGVFTVDMESMVPAESMKGMEGMEITIDQTDLKFPASLEVGQTLPDASITFKAATNGINVMTMVIDITERKVEAAESIEVPAGTFQCLKLSSKSKTKMGFVNVEVSSIDWISPNVGSVRSESYDKKGNLEGYRVLKSLSK